MCITPQNAGEFWTAVGAIATFLAVLVAMFLIFKEYFFQGKKNFITRFALLAELRNLHESYFGKILHYIAYDKNKVDCKIPESDRTYFNNIENLKSKMSNLSKLENTTILEIISIYKETLYRKDRDGNDKINWDNIRGIEKKSNISINLLISNLKLSKKQRLLNPREESYKKIQSIYTLQNRPVPSMDDIKSELL